MLTRLFFKRRDADPAERGRFTWLSRVLHTRPGDIDPLQSDDLPGEGFEAAWRAALTRRVVVVLGAIGLWVVGIEARLVQLQVVESAWYSDQAQRRQEDTIEPEAVRGDIVDRNGEILAYSVAADSIIGDPKRVEKPAQAVAALCGALRDCTDKERKDLLGKLSGKGRFVYVRRSRMVSPDQVQRVSELKLPGIALFAGTRRYYPRFELASHVLGFVDGDNAGKEGLEYTYDKAMHGTDGLALVKVDAHRTRLETRIERAPERGATLELTLDLSLQYLVERELKAGVEAHRAQAGSAIVMNPATGEILAMANYPTFNPNAVGRSTADDRRNRAVADLYEPGSTFKIITASAALEEGLNRPTDLIDCNPGFIKFPGRKPITEASGHSYGVLSFEDVIVRSSNVGAIKIGQEVGIDRLSRYVTRFGFGQALTRDFIGARKGQWAPSSLDASGLASVSMGYQVGVTPLQMVTAASAVANGGVLVEPHVVKAVTKDGRRSEIAPKGLRRVISPETAAALTTIMEAVTERGTAKTAALANYLVAGKTGTAQKIVDGVYSKSAYNASFVGFVPSRRPEYAIIVVIDSPSTGVYVGGLVAAPIFKRIAEAALQLRGVAPTINPNPPIMVDATSTTVPVRANRPATLMPMLTPAGGRPLMPDVRGLSAREAVRALAQLGMSVRASGSGIVAVQSPEAGEPFEPGSSVHLELRRFATAESTPGARR